MRRLFFPCTKTTECKFSRFHSARNGTVASPVNDVSFPVTCLCSRTSFLYRNPANFPVAELPGLSAPPRLAAPPARLSAIGCPQTRFCHRPPFAAYRHCHFQGPRRRPAAVPSIHPRKMGPPNQVHSSNPRALLARLLPHWRWAVVSPFATATRPQGDSSSSLPK